MAKQKKKILILGGGFGGLYTYKGLYKHFSHDEVDITIINRNNYFLFTPLLHEVATGSIAHHQVVESIRQLIYKTNDTLHIAEVTSIDCQAQIVKTNISEFNYDILVISLGATTNFFNAPGAEEHSFVLKDLRDAIRLRTDIIESFEKASEIKDVELRRKSLSFAVVGGGPTGVEVVSEICELIHDTLLKYYHTSIDHSDVSLYLVNRDEDILLPFPPSLRKNALNILRRKGVKVMLNSPVKEVQADQIIFDDNSTLPVSHVIWTAGVKPNIPPFQHELALDRGGRIIVNNFLQVTECPNVFVIGDIASLPDSSGRPLPMLAQVAVNQGIHTGENIWRLVNNKNLKPFLYKSKGELVSLGRWQAEASIKGVRISGPLAWFIWRTIYLFKFISKSKRVKIVIDWTINAFYPRDITKA
ncbi:MAG: NAD(P)/FAD-dependent oxidoreductase [Patescibacteria group bacterium]|nr:NAD(P)/FAD-dependent oxidoreductase [Patescibacteria group bacterium]